MPFPHLGHRCPSLSAILALGLAVSASAQPPAPERQPQPQAPISSPDPEQPAQPSTEPPIVEPSEPQGTVRAQFLDPTGPIVLEEPRDPDTSLWAPGRIAAYERSLLVPMDPIAVLEIPRLGLRVGVFPGTDEVTLDRGVGHVPETPPPGSDGNVAVAGHRDGYFRVLKDVELGDVLRLVTPGGVREYAIASTAVVDPEDVSVLAPTPEPALTLIACFPFYYVGHAPQRFIARALPIGGPASD
jgi:LPXTG-site transpeptidase (sortase) family protein